ncbi:MAG: NADPH:quinone reductase [Deltaproteobacteria bacterium]|nr:NADPH:quinone reductase [Deltaproteobacteria bacterium]
MRAIRVEALGGPEVMKLVEVADPTPAPGEVLIRVHAAGVNPVDTYIRSGAQGYAAPVPYTPGSDAAGVVEAVGPGVTGLSVGARVFTARTLTGAYAEKTLCAEKDVHPLPEGVAYAQGAAVGVPYAAAYRALFQRARAEAGEVVLVHGATGGVGIAAVQFARAAGLTVIGTGGDPEGRSLAAAEGAHHVLDHDDPEHLHRAMALTSGRGVDLILEMLANVNLGRDLTALAQGGRVVVIGSRGTVELDPRDAMRREAAILGMLLFAATERERDAAYAAIGAGLENRTLRPVIGRELPLAEAPAAHRLVLEWGGYGKIVLMP